MDPLNTKFSESLCADDGKVCTADVSDLIAKAFKITNVTKPEDVIKEAAKKLKCDDELCVVEHLPAEHSRAIIQTKFKPRGPRLTTNLLSNVHIDKVLDTWTRKYKKFYHVEFQMIDFAEMKTELATLDISRLIRQYNNIGVVINSDETSGRGKHWFCIFCDLKAEPITIEYFNSSGREPYPQIKAWMLMTKELLEDRQIKSEPVVVSRIQHQQSDTECGMYSLYYIWCRLEGIPHHKFDERPIPDKLVTKFRKSVFIPDNEEQKKQMLTGTRHT